MTSAPRSASSDAAYGPDTTVVRSTTLRRSSALIGASGGNSFLQIEKDEPASESALLVIRILASVVPAAFLLLSLWFARGYGLTRDEHGRILAALVERDRVA